MLRPVVIGACLACLLGGVAYAVDEETGNSGCTEQLTAAEEAVQNKIDANALSDDETNKVNELLDEAQYQCTEGDVAGATQTLQSVSAMIAK